MSRVLRCRKAAGQSGQVMVEQAIIMPMMVFMILGILQLSMIQHARICTEVAAFEAARSGIVYNGDPKKMERAALLSLMPTLGRSDSWGAIWSTFLQKAMLSQFGPDLADALGLDILGSMKMVKVEILDHPDPNVGNRLAILNQQTHLNRSQIDFDDWRTAPAIANQLTIHVRYFYKMRIPFANWFLQYIWMAQHADAFSAFGGGATAFLTPEHTVLGHRTGISSHREILAKAIINGDEEMRAVLLYKGLGENRIPINTYYTMRMQSNLYRTYLEGN